MLRFDVCAVQLFSLLLFCERLLLVRLMEIAGARLGSLVMMMLLIFDVAVVGAADVCCVPSRHIVTIDDGC